jgi:hypothetical protein
MLRVLSGWVGGPALGKRGYTMGFLLYGIVHYQR